MKQFLNEVKNNHIDSIRVPKKDNTEHGLDEQIKQISKIANILSKEYQSAISDNERRTILESIRREIRNATDIYLKKLNTDYEAQYHQHEIEKNTVLEHTIPLNQLCSSWFRGDLTFQELIRMPTCRLRKRQAKKVDSRSKNKNTNLEYPFRRYAGIVDVIFRKDGKKIDPLTYSIQEHIKYFIND